MQEAEKLSLEEIRQLLEASEGIRFAGVKRAQVYGWIELVLCEQEYARQGKASVFSLGQRIGRVPLNPNLRVMDKIMPQILSEEESHPN